MWEDLKGNTWSWSEQGFKVSIRIVYFSRNWVEDYFIFQFYFVNVSFNLKQKISEDESPSKLYDFQRVAG